MFASEPKNRRPLEEENWKTVASADARTCNYRRFKAGPPSRHSTAPSGRSKTGSWMLVPFFFVGAPFCIPNESPVRFLVQNCSPKRRLLLYFGPFSCFAFPAIYRIDAKDSLINPRLMVVDRCLSTYLAMSGNEDHPRRRRQ